MATPLAPALVERLLEAARTAQGRAHAPYSRFHVGAAVLDEHGHVHSGCNVENAAYPQGSCAETNAFGALVAAGGKQVRALLVLGDGENLVTPCGGCRQRLRELAAPDTPVLIAGPGGVRATFTLDELLPHSFGPENLALCPGRGPGRGSP
ncbi:MAG: cytidine deaminase [Usitatibacter sp.]